MWVILLLGACAQDALDAQPLPLDLPDTLVDDHPAAPLTQPADAARPGFAGGESITAPPPGSLGSPCTEDLARPHEGGVCLTDAEGFPAGYCSLACEQFCPDAEGYPTTFCGTTSALPPDVGWLGDGGCLQRCDFGAYPYAGCRQDYGCAKAERANEPGTETWVCLPEVDSELTTCLADLAARGVPFSPTVIPDESPPTHPDLTCHVEDPIAFGQEYLGIDLIYYDGAVPRGVKGACNFGHALANTFEDVADDGVLAIRHLGTTVCRVINDSDTLSRHSYGDAIDLWGFDFDDGTTITLEDHWEHDTTDFSTEEAEWLYDTSHGWHDAKVWNIILTPNYNSDHNNHFHVDLTPDADYIGLR